MEHPTAANKWYCTPSATARGVVVLVHGLNQHPASWKDMLPALNSWGYHVYLLCLKGHRGLTKNGMFHVNAEIWLQNFLDGYHEASSRFPLLPQLLVAYSLGALVAIVAQGKLARPLFERQVLLAPAIVTKPYTRLVLLISKFLPVIPSSSPEYYRANKNGVSAAGYRALFELEQTLRKEQQYTFPPCPTRIFMRSNDEFISYRGLKRLLLKKQVHAYQIRTVPVNSQKAFLPPYNHLIIDRQGLSEHQWLWLMSQMQSFLEDGT